MKKSDVIKKILDDRFESPLKNFSANAFAPTNIALCKYWGKRNQVINLPVTSSLSISLGNKGAEVHMQSASQDEIFLNKHPIKNSEKFAIRLIEFLNLFRHKNDFFKVEIQSNIPIAAGLASSACGFASLVKALNQLYGWNLSEQSQSILARLGSGSASRSIWQGFVEWQAGNDENGLDSFAFPLSETWPEFCVGLLIFSSQEKKHSSREAMQRTVATSSLYAAWPSQVKKDLETLKAAIQKQDFELLGQTAESNALAMHATMLSAVPAICYWLPETLVAMEKVWELRANGILVYFTQDAGPNLKLLFLEKDRDVVSEFFPHVEIVRPFVD